MNIANETAGLMWQPEILPIALAIIIIVILLSFASNRAEVIDMLSDINDNYDKNITLKVLSDKFDLTVPYLSYFFDV